MSGEVVFLLEERSMKAFLDELLPRVVPELQYKLVSHEGKRDLVNSFPRKLKAWCTPAARFVIVYDQDSANCIALKQKLQALVPEARRSVTWIRIACRELESWLLGDLDALAKAFNKPAMTELVNKKKFRHPDRLGNPAEELCKLVPDYQKIKGARLVAQFIEPDTNTSHSFGVFMRIIHQLNEDEARTCACNFPSS